MTGRKRREEKKEQRKKARAKQKVLRRRKRTRKLAKEAHQAEKEQEHFRIKQVPYCKDRDNPVAELQSASQQLGSEPKVTAQTKVDDPRKVEWIKHKLEHNMEILEALEAEIAEEEEDRLAIHEELEKKGATTIREKMDMVGFEAEARVAEAENIAPAGSELVPAPLPREGRKGLKFKGKSTARMTPNKKARRRSAK
jgi:hypothetical protein